MDSFCKCLLSFFETSEKLFCAGRKLVFLPCMEIYTVKNISSSKWREEKGCMFVLSWAKNGVLDAYFINCIQSVLLYICSLLTLACCLQLFIACIIYKFYYDFSSRRFHSHTLTHISCIYIFCICFTYHFIYRFIYKLSAVVGLCWFMFFFLEFFLYK